MKKLLILLPMFFLLISLASANQLIENVSSGDDDDTGVGMATIAQNFTIGFSTTNQDYIPTFVGFKAFRTGTVDEIVVTIREMNATGPNSTIISTGNFSGSLITEISPGQFYYVAMSGGILRESTNYAIVINSTPTASDTLKLRTAPNPYGGGYLFASSDSGSSWSDFTALDILFELNGTDATGLSTLLNSPPNNTVFSSTTQVFNATGTVAPTSNLTNGTIHIWYTNNSIFNTTTVEATGSPTNDTIFNILGLIFGTFNWNVEMCQINSTGNTACAFATLNRTFSLGASNISGISMSVAYETAAADFQQNFTVPSGLTISSSKLYFNGTEHDTTVTTIVSNNFSLSSIFDYPLGSTLRNFFWEVILSDGNRQNTTIQTITVDAINLTLCAAAPQDISYINFTFGNETIDKETVSSTIDSTFIYWLGAGTSNKTLAFSNSSENFNYTFCFSPPNQTINSKHSINYNNGESQQRTYEETIVMTNITTERTLWLLPTSEGGFVTFQVVNVAGQIIRNALVVLSRSGFGDVSIQETSSSGTVSFFLNPDVTYTLDVSKTGFDSFTSTQTFPDTSFTITLSQQAQVVNEDLTKGVSWTILPETISLVNDTAVNFNFSISTSFWELERFGFVLKNQTATLGSTSSSSTSGGLVNILFNTGSNTEMIMEAFYVINGNYTNFTRSWVVIPSGDTSFSILRFFEDLSSYLESGMFGMGSFGLRIIIFLIIFLFIGIMSFQFGLNAPGALTVAAFSLIAFFDVGLGILPNPVGAVNNFPTILALLVVIAIFIKGGTR